MIRTFKLGHHRVAKIVLLTSTLWLCVSTVICPQIPTKLQTGERRASQEVRFEVILQGDGRTDDGVPTYFTSFRSSNGSIVYETIIDFPSATRSTRELDGLLKSSVKVLRNKNETDKDGRDVGKSVLVLIPSKLHTKPAAVLAWTDGAHYTDVRCESLDDLLQFEKKLLDREKKGVDAPHRSKL